MCMQNIMEKENCADIAEGGNQYFLPIFLHRKKKVKELPWKENISLEPAFL